MGIKKAELDDDLKSIKCCKKVPTFRDLQQILGLGLDPRHH
jgi:hypothetical protein